MTINPEESVKLLGVLFDCKLSFNTHVNNLCKKASKQINVMKRFSKILSEKHKLAIFQSFLLSNFDYCPIIWNFCSKAKARLIEKMQERGLRYVYNDSTSSYKDLLKRTKRETMCNIRLKKIAIQVYKCVHKIGPSYLHDSFNQTETTYDMRDKSKLIQPKVNTVTHGLLSFQYHGAKIWNNLPNVMKQASTISKFKLMLKKYNKPLCACSFCSFAE